LFYVLRPAAAIRWLARRPKAAIAPMHFPTLIAESELPADVAAIVANLLERKAATRELGTGPLPQPLAAFVEGELEWARPKSARRRHGQRREQHAMCETFFAKTVRRFDPLS